MLLLPEPTTGDDMPPLFESSRANERLLIERACFCTFRFVDEYINIFFYEIPVRPYTTPCWSIESADLLSLSAKSALLTANERKELCQREHEQSSYLPYADERKVPQKSDERTSKQLPIPYIFRNTQERRKNHYIQRVSTKETKENYLNGNVLSKEKRRPGSKGVVRSSQPDAQIQKIRYYYLPHVVCMCSRYAWWYAAKPE